MINSNGTDPERHRVDQLQYIEEIAYRSPLTALDRLMGLDAIKSPVQIAIADGLERYADSITGRSADEIHSLAALLRANGQRIVGDFLSGLDDQVVQHVDAVVIQSAPTDDSEDELQDPVFGAQSYFIRLILTEKGWGYKQLSDYIKDNYEARTTAQTLKRWANGDAKMQVGMCY